MGNTSSLGAMRATLLDFGLQLAHPLAHKLETKVSESPEVIVSLELLYRSWAYPDFLSILPIDPSVHGWLDEYFLLVIATALITK